MWRHDDATGRGSSTSVLLPSTIILAAIFGRYWAIASTRICSVVSFHLGKQHIFIY